MGNVIDVRSTAVQDLLVQVRDRVEHPEGVLRAIGEDMEARIKGRFSTSTAPDGTPWRPNTAATIIQYIKERNGFSGKTGKILAKGQTLAMGKKPLVAGGTLAKQIFYDVSQESLVIGSSMEYAAMQHFGGTKAQFPKLWGDIPARPFMPITPGGDLYPQEETFIVEQLRAYLAV